eukprot:gnl/TRDRNA2_/TRDRNA2_188070_c0_seq1.p1 gnl/TRDRNA2_/TRDRNA2_188070_c0~~gnl/TRDRNA2_/TRDRNA2_188070_c0_seq1.p1  ORF type:complete len:141 (-),score=38.43 gnl/TRDRNA2_/TRDRNA2_188070_c0_seq1:205-627(-)
MGCGASTTSTPIRDFHSHSYKRYVLKASQAEPTAPAPEPAISEASTVDTANSLEIVADSATPDMEAVPIEDESPAPVMMLAPAMSMSEFVEAATHVPEAGDDAASEVKLPDTVSMPPETAKQQEADEQATAAMPPPVPAA